MGEHGFTTPIPSELDELSGQVIGAAMEVHKALGPGLLELAYAACLCRELNLRGVAFEREKSFLQSASRPAKKNSNSVSSVPRWFDLGRGFWSCTGSGGLAVRPTIVHPFSDHKDKNATKHCAKMKSTGLEASPPEDGDRPSKKALDLVDHLIIVNYPKGSKDMPRTTRKTKELGLVNIERLAYMLWSTKRIC
jgi:hypothetical protein